jgi:hypothetical protein
MKRKVKKSGALKVTQVTYSRLQTTGPYENERLEVVVPVQSGDGTKEARAAKAVVLELLGIRQDAPAFETRRGHGPVCICDECM